MKTIIKDYLEQVKVGRKQAYKNLADIRKPPTELRELFKDDLCDVLPLLKNLSDIRYWVWEHDTWKVQYSLEVDPKLCQRVGMVSLLWIGAMAFGIK